MVWLAPVRIVLARWRGVCVHYMAYHWGVSVVVSLSTGGQPRLLPDKPGRPFALLAAVGVVCAALSGFTTSTRANDLEVRGDPIAELRNYVQLVATAQPDTAAAAGTNQAPANLAQGESDGDGYAALRAFVQRTAVNPPQAAPDRLQVAEADNAYDALQEFLQKQNGTAPPEQTTAPAPKTKKGAKPKPLPAPVEATYVGSNVCPGCHTSQAQSFGYTLMGRLQKQGKLQCESCHGAGSAHVKAGGGIGVGGIISFRPDDTSRTAEENNSICLGCHERGERTYWEGSVHEERGLACTNCHTIMKGVSAQYQLKTAFQPDTCFQCHKDRKAQMFRSSHMPMREGKVVCSDCHNPHGSPYLGSGSALLRTDSINDTCYKCHAEKRGPFLFEHEPVRENCLNCHDPHGSINESSLKMSRPRLCFECHTIGPHGSLGTTGPFSDLTMSRACNNCHTMIHGSNSPAGAALQR